MPSQRCEGPVYEPVHRSEVGGVLGPVSWGVYQRSNQCLQVALHKNYNRPQEVAVCSEPNYYL
jgi:hypothetical protein